MCVMSVFFRERGVILAGRIMRIFAVQPAIFIYAISARLPWLLLGEKAVLCVEKTSDYD